MPNIPVERIKQIKCFSSLVQFLKDELNWQLDTYDIEDLTYDYDPEELGLSENVAQKINEIKQLRPFSYDQPWGIFYIDFEPKRLPVVVLRLILQKLKIKKKTAAGSPNMRHWELNDLLFISSYGLEEERSTTFAHFSKENEDSAPVLRVITWDTKDTQLHLERCLSELSNLRYDPDTSVDQWREKWIRGFVLLHRHSITTSKALAKKLAELARDIRENCQDMLNAEKESGPFHKTMNKFKKALIHDLTTEDFADMYAQTIAYGLLYTAIRSHIKGEGQIVSAEHVQQLVLPTNPFLKEVMEDFFNIGSRKWDSEQEKLTGIEFDDLGVNEIISTLKDDKTDFDAILRDFMNRNPNEDPVIHFYELFLKEYDSLKRKSRGVYYTPQPVVSFIVRSVHELLQKDFGLKYGLADTTTWGQMIEKNPQIKIPEGVKEDDFFVQILDPALGTGTFLVETISIIHETMKEAWEKHGLKKEEIQEHWNKYVPEKLLPRLFGFELMMAPYAIAHMKIGIKLFETGYKNFAIDKKRVQVYLTNTLEEPLPMATEMRGVLAEEGSAAAGIRLQKSITVIIGNPPYANFGKMNKNEWILGLLSEYKKGLNERKINIDDDFIKFIRFGQWFIDCVGTGILMYITNHTFIDGITHRRMRQSLLGSSAMVSVVNLHGSVKKGGEKTRRKKDENVFDIQQGVSINAFVKHPSISSGQVKVKYGEMLASRSKKYETLSQSTLSDLAKEIILPSPDLYLFTPTSGYTGNKSVENSGIESIFKIFSSGIDTKCDRLLIDQKSTELINRVKNLLNPNKTADDIRREYEISERSTWELDRVKTAKFDKNKITPILYRLFQEHFTYFDVKVLSRARESVMRHMLKDSNIALISTRQMSQLGGRWSHIFATYQIIERCAISNRTKEGNYLFPLYVWPLENKGKGQMVMDMDISPWPAGLGGRVPNLNKNFVDKLAKRVGMKFVSDGKGDLNKNLGPEDIFDYIYGVFHSLSYRIRYAEFLKRDFPRVPLTSNTDLFRDLSTLGENLVSLHLMESDKLNNHITTFPIKGDNAVTKVGETKKKLKDLKGGKGKLYINATQYFDDLPEEVWNFHIGCYQVCYKWLYDRKKAGRKLSAEDIEHYHKIVVAINETIKIMKQIDEVIDAHGGWPIS